MLPIFASAEHVDLAAPHEMRIVEGELEQVIELGRTDPKNEDYLLVRLMDKHAILNPMETFACCPNGDGALKKCCSCINRKFKIL